MNKLLKASLLGSSSALGYNWIYDSKLLIERAKTHNMIFENIDHDLYKKAENGFDVYPNHKIGDLDFMGEVLYLFHMFFDYEREQTLSRWRHIFYEYFREDYEYDGYIESYGKDFLGVYKKELDNLKEPQVFTDHIDKQLVGLIFLLALYDNENSHNSVEDALKYARTLTAFKQIEPLTIMLFELLKLLDSGKGKKDSLEEAIKLSPDEYKEQFTKAITMSDTENFIKEYSGVACGIEQALPLIFFIFANATNWEEALKINATLGGASSARGLFISALFSRLEEIPEKYSKLLKYDI